MTIWFISEVRFGRTADGKPAPLEAANRDGAWSAYEGLGNLAMVARVGDEASHLDPTELTLLPVPYWRGLRSLTANLFRILRFFRRLTSREGVFLLRMPGTVTFLAAAFLILRRREYYVELVADAASSARTHGSTVARWAAPLLASAQRLMVRRSAGCRYVTDYTLQTRYPVAKNRPSVGYADVELGPFLQGVRDERIDRSESGFTITAVGSQEALHKGHDVLIRAIALLESKNARAVIVGRGVYHSHLKRLAAELGVSSRVQFVQQLRRAEIVEQLQKTDVFVMPSRAEGLGRAMLEAMASGAACIGTTVDGLAELLPPRWQVPPDRPDLLAERIDELLSSPHMMLELGLSNRRFVRAKLEKWSSEQRRWLSVLENPKHL